MLCSTIEEGLGCVIALASVLFWAGPLPSKMINPWLLEDRLALTLYQAVHLDPNSLRDCLGQVHCGTISHKVEEVNAHASLLQTRSKTKKSVPRRRPVGFPFCHSNHH